MSHLALVVLDHDRKTQMTCVADINFQNPAVAGFGRSAGFGQIYVVKSGQRAEPGLEENYCIGFLSCSKDKDEGPVFDVALLHDEHMLRSALQSRKCQLIGMS